LVAFLPSLVESAPARAGAEFRVNATTASDQIFPKVGMSGIGNFVVVWDSYGQDGESDGIFARRFRRSGTAIDASEFQVNVYTSSYQFSPSIAVADSGAFVVVWTSSKQDGYATGIFGRRYDSAGRPLDAVEFQINTYTTSYQLFPEVAVSGSGDFVVVWQSYGQDGSGEGIFGRRFASSGAPLDAEEFQINTITANAQRAAAVDTIDSGGFVVAWQSYDEPGQNFEIFARRYDSAGSPLDAQEFQVNTYTTGSQTVPSVAAWDDGEFVVAWQSDDQDGDGPGVFARRYDSSGSPLDDEEFEINAYSASLQGGPSAAARPTGEFAVAWQSLGQDGYGHGVFGRWFDSDGVSGEPEDVPVNTQTYSNQGYADAAASPAGDFVVVWMSFDQDGSGYGIFAQQFACPDADGDGICDTDDIVITSHVDGDTLDCRTPGMAATRPTITWQRGNYDRFRAMISWKPNFPKKNRIDTGKDLIGRDSWTPGRKAWKRACSNGASGLYIRVFGVDQPVGTPDPTRRTRASDVPVNTLR